MSERIIQVWFCTGDLTSVQYIVLKERSVKSSSRLSLDWCQECCWLELLEEMPQEKKEKGKKD